jgi:Tol biopolymer transport system component
MATWPAPSLGSRPPWLVFGLALVPVALLADSHAFVTARQQLTSSATFADAASLSLGGDGRFLAFSSDASLVPADTNGTADVYVLDLVSGRLTVESLAPEPRRGAYIGNRRPRISADGRVVVFEDTVIGPDGPRRAAIMADRQTGRTREVDAVGGGVTPDGHSRQPALSGDGRRVAFVSSATNLVAGSRVDSTREAVYVLDVESGRIEPVSVDASGVLPAHGTSHSPALCGTGRFVAFVSTARLGEGPESGRRRGPASHAVANVYVRDMLNGTTRRVTHAQNGGGPDGPSSHPVLSGDGHTVVFVSAARNLVAGDRNGAEDVFVRDLATATTSLVSRSAAGGSGNGQSRLPAVSADGRFVVFQSTASDLVCARRCSGADRDINLVADVFLADREERTIVRLSRDEHAPWMAPSGGPAIDARGRVIAFSSFHPTGADDVRHDADAFVWTRQGASGHVASPPLR